MVAAFVLSQVILIPILGALLYGMRRERNEYKNLVKLACIAASRRRRR